VVVPELGNAVDSINHSKVSKILQYVVRLYPGGYLLGPYEAILVEHKVPVVHGGRVIGGDLRKKLQRLRVVLVGVGGADAGTFERHGYAGAMRTQIDHGIFDYCGAQVVRSELLLESESADPIRHLDQALHIGSQLFAARGAQGAAQAQPLEA